jgi:RING finger/CHY zinc finger protein 1
MFNCCTKFQTICENVEGVMSREYSCEHYDRYCNAQFACCEPYWPCHRCHNAKSQCGEKKLRSRDIKKLKCRRCGKLQDFPKASPHCVECNLKFAEYFCPVCQYLTGEQNHPFHCEKCGVCKYVP